MMRTTVDLPDDLHRATTSLARDRGQSLSQIVSELIRQALQPQGGDGGVGIDAATGLPLVRVGHPVTSEMVRTATDER